MGLTPNLLLEQEGCEKPVKNKVQKNGSAVKKES
jgi:hypothetical protein